MYKPHKINFSRPFRAAAWLRLLEANPEVGMTFKKSMMLKSRKAVGFRFSTNSAGFRGALHADPVDFLSGTSFAMGLGVDDGCNWYELLSEVKNNYLNVAMPVGVYENIQAIKKFQQRPARHLLYIYHPNIWKISGQFRAARTAGVDIFTHLRWRSSRRSALAIMPKWAMRSLMRRSLHDDRCLPTGFQYASDYCYFPHRESELAEISRQETVMDFIALFSLFEKVTMVRVPTKEQIIYLSGLDTSLRHLIENYDELWSNLISHVQTLDTETITFDACSSEIFSTEGFLPNDNHWSPQGNFQFANFISENITLSE